MLNKDTALNATLYILNKLGSVDMHKLSKILYFADREHLARYGRAITGDGYIAMQYGPVPSAVYDTIKLAAGHSCLPHGIAEAQACFSFTGKMVEARRDADMDYLSGSDVECLDHAIAVCRDKTFAELVAMSHDYAWHNTEPNRRIALADIMREAGCEDDYIAHIVAQTSIEEELCYGIAG